MGIEAARLNHVKVTQERESALNELAKLGQEIEATIQVIRASNKPATTEPPAPPEPHAKDHVVEAFSKKIDEAEPPKELLDFGLDKHALKQVMVAMLKWVAADDPAGKRRKDADATSAARAGAAVTVPPETPMVVS